eukprot:403334057
MLYSKITIGKDFQNENAKSAKTDAGAKYGQNFSTFRSSPKNQVQDDVLNKRLQTETQNQNIRIQNISPTSQYTISNSNNQGNSNSSGGGSGGPTGGGIGFINLSHDQYTLISEDYEDSHGQKIVKNYSLNGETVMFKIFPKGPNGQFLTTTNDYPINKIHTSKYNKFNFIPKILFLKLKNATYLFFLLISVLQLTKLSNLNQTPFELISLVVMLILITIVEYMDDFKRKRSDQRENKRLIQVYEFQNLKKNKSSKKSQIHEERNGKFSQSQDYKFALNQTEQITQSNFKDSHNETDFNIRQTSISHLSGAGGQAMSQLQTSMNFGQSQTYQSGHFINKKWENIRVGNIVKIEQNELIPADIILIKSSCPQGLCYLESQNLQGENDLLKKNSDKLLQTLIEYQQQSIDTISFLQGDVICDSIDENHHNFNASIYLNEPTNKKVTVYEKQLLLRGCKLKNTEWIIGLVVAAGHNTKIMKNTIKLLNKRSFINRDLNIQVVIILAFQIFLSVLSAIYYVHHNQGKGCDSNSNQLDKTQEDNLNCMNPVTLVFYESLLWLIQYNNLIPISLLFSLEFVRFFQSYFIQNDMMMYDEDQMAFPSVQSSQLLEELGQVQIVFSDKTGTMTANVMKLRKIACGEFQYAPIFDEVKDKMRGQCNFQNHWKEKGQNYENIKRFFIALSVCHQLSVDENTQEFYGQSQEEIAILNGLRLLDMKIKIQNEEITISIINKRVVKYKILHVLEYTSSRRMMSVIVQDETEEIVLFSKGSDDALIPKINLKQKKSEEYDLMVQSSQQFATEGLRTLLVTMRVLEQSEFKQFQIATQIDRRQSQAALDQEIYDKLERELTLIGCVALEDRLQEGVDTTIDFIKESGVKIWMITGDKLETAICIGYSSCLLDQDMTMFQLSRLDNMEEVIDEALSECAINNGEKCLIIVGDCFSALQSIPDIFEKFMMLAEQVDVALGCRFSPMQKEAIIRAYKKKFPFKLSLAIGDGANDASMISTAHIGIGIKSNEWQQAQRSADIVISKFEHLLPLMYIHGRESFRRNTFLIGSYGNYH